MTEFENYENHELRGEVIDNNWFESQFIMPVKDSFGTYRWRSKIHHVVLEVDDVVIGTLKCNQLFEFQRNLRFKDFQGCWIVVHVFKSEDEFHFTIAFDH